MIKIVLSAANMGNVDEADFDAWAGYVCDNIDGGVAWPASADGHDLCPVAVTA